MYTHKYTRQDHVGSTKSSHVNDKQIHLFVQSLKFMKSVALFLSHTLKTTAEFFFSKYNIDKIVFILCKKVYIDDVKYLDCVHHSLWRYLLNCFYFKWSSKSQQKKSLILHSARSLNLHYKICSFFSLFLEKDKI